jgi:hypothetical protein
MYGPENRMSFEQALPIVMELVRDLDETEKLRLLTWANKPRAEAVESTLIQNKKRGGGPSGDDQEQKVMIAAVSGTPRTKPHYLHPCQTSS